MMRNDYRRSLILLRCNAPGYSGHVRLERRTLMGSMYFTVQAPEDGSSLRAALVGRGRDSYYACPLGELRRDGRGQATLSWSFDPRNICGRELEQYQLIAIARVAQDGCDGVLYGNVAGHAELNWERVRQALCLSVQDGGVARSGEAASAELAPAEEAFIEKADTEKADTAATRMEEADTEEVPVEKVPIEEVPVEEVQLEVASDEAGTAGERLGLDMSLAWPEEIEPLREGFRSQQAMEDGPAGDYIYIKTPLPEGSPYPYMAAGLRAEGGVPVQASFALPAAYAPEPPSGLEEYAWVGDQNRGWWVIELSL